MAAVICNASGNAIVRICPISIGNFCLGAGGATVDVNAGTCGANWVAITTRPFATETSID